MLEPVLEKASGKASGWALRLVKELEPGLGLASALGWALESGLELELETGWALVWGWASESESV